MPLSAGDRLGPHEILSPLGAGGMGEVYRARDTRLNRDVAIKVLPAEIAADHARRSRFQQEARAAGALNHPNIVCIYEIGTSDDSTYVVMELLEGETLQDRLAGGPLLERKAIDYASQIAQGLAAAHARGIVHRDIKPANLFLTRTGYVKILDFGLAKQVDAAFRADQTVTRASDTQPGLVLGTPGYMSPEQVRGLPADHRSDIFSFGVVLYEMLAGQQPFRGPSTIETLNSILKDDPPPLKTSRKDVSPLLEQVVVRCLEKNPEERFQSLTDLYFILQAISGASSGVQPVIAGKAQPRRRTLAYSLAAVAAMIALGAAWWAGRSSAKAPQPTYTWIPAPKGPVREARFLPDGTGVIYGVAHENGAYEIFSAKTGGLQAHPLGIKDADLLAISRKQELAVSLGFRNAGLFEGAGKLGVGVAESAAPRVVMDDVSFADWSPDGDALLVLRTVERKDRLESPPGHVLFQSNAGQALSYPRFSPDGKQIAFFEHSERGDNSGTLDVIDLKGTKTVLTKNFEWTEGIAWHPVTGEIWFAAENAIRVITPGKPGRVVQNFPTYLSLLDINAKGQFLLSMNTYTGSVICRPPGEAAETELTWFPFPTPSSISADGTMLVIDHAFGDYPIAVQNTSGGPPVLIGSGRSVAMSPDGKWVLARPRPGEPTAVQVLPTGAGQAYKVDVPGLLLAGRWLPGGGKLLVSTAGRGKPPQTYLQELQDEAPVGKPRLVAPPGFTAGPVDPDGKSFICYNAKTFRCFLDGAEPKPMSFIPPNEYAVAWSDDGKYVYTAVRVMMPIKVFRVDVTSGRRELWRELIPANRSGILAMSTVVMNPAATAYAYRTRGKESSLTLVEGLR